MPGSQYGFAMLFMVFGIPALLLGVLWVMPRIGFLPSTRGGRGRGRENDESTKNDQALLK